MTINIQISEAASSYIKMMLEKNKGVGFRLSVKKTGCSGYSYLPAIVNEMNPNDTMVEIDGIKLFVDTTWLHLLQELSVDYIEEDKTGLKQKRLVFTNPKEGNRCGCGESFQIT
jgi:iron-sulfur cluster assembly accessory protein